jgi:hypothetical protein
MQERVHEGPTPGTYLRRSKKTIVAADFRIDSGVSAQKLPGESKLCWVAIRENDWHDAA